MADGFGLGLQDLDLDDLKAAAISMFQPGAASKKRRKMTHELFFEDDKGFKNMLETFPKIKFGGKGKEFEDLKLLMRHYSKWFQELYPSGERPEDLAWKARTVLADKEKLDSGDTSDAREQLNVLRFKYKEAETARANAPRVKATSNMSDETRKRIEENRQRALALKRAREQSAKPGAAEDMDMEAMWEAEMAAAQPAVSAPRPATSFDDEEDPFGFGYGIEGGAPTQRPGNTAIAQPASTFMDDEDDVFGLGGGFDDDVDVGQPPPQVSKPQPQMSAKQHTTASTFLDEEDDDVFGFGGGMADVRTVGRSVAGASQVANLPAPDAPPPVVPPPAAPPQTSPPPVEPAQVPSTAAPLSSASASVLSPEEMARRIQENRARALEVKRKRLEAAAAAGGT
uniref:Chromosome segregation in meiosis protein 3 domain-containing protein n=1 Tax=Noctiluca scintillans TaxID=2966 RepID=A0A7S1F4A7_NOCSC